MIKTATFAAMFNKTAKWLFLFLLLSFSWSSIAQAEEITSFVSDIVVQADSSLLITETITYDFGSEQKHGIFRNIKDKHAQPTSVWYKTRYIDLNLISVTKDGLPEPYVLESYNGLSVKIGDANVFVTGSHVYKIKYTVAGALSIFPDKTELYWNVTGDEWPVSILSTEARVRVQSPVRIGVENYCYVGIVGSVAKCASVKSEADHTAFLQSLIYSGEQLTVAQSLNLTQPPVVLEKYNLLILWIVSLATALTLIIVGVYRWRTKYKDSRPIIAQYEPYANFKPMFTGVLFDNSLDSRDISAGIVYLAQQGFISIKQISDKKIFLFDATDYEVTLKRPITETQVRSHKQLLSLLLGDSAAVGDSIKLIADSSLEKMKNNRKTIQSLKESTVKDLKKRGFYEKWASARLGLGQLFIVLFVSFVSFLFLVTGEIRQNIYPSLAISGIIIAFTSERRTKKGYEALNHLKGFKLFLSVTEKERYEFHNAPALSPQEFMEHLPYAIAFGVEKKWAEVFKDIKIESPEWYSSAAGNAFSANAFTTDLSAFSSSFASSSGTSGSSGGGSSGGGSGGGGGGSW